MQQLRRLARRRSIRNAASVFLLDGPKLIAEALDAAHPLMVLYAEPAADTALVQRAATAGTEVVEVPEGSLRKVLDLVNPQPVVAVAPQRRAIVAEILNLASHGRRPVILLVQIQDPGNAGTLIRVAEAAGCAGVIISEGSVDLWNPKTVRASAGSVMRVPVAAAPDVPDVLDSAQEIGLPVVATVGSAGVAPESCALDAGCVVLVGAEAHGLPEAVLARADTRVSIPMAGSVESLNAAVAGAVLVFEAARQRRVAGGAVR